MEVALMCLANNDIPEPSWYCWTCAKTIETKEVEKHDKLYHEIQEEEN